MKRPRWEISERYRSLDWISPLWPFRELVACWWSPYCCDCPRWPNLCRSCWCASSVGRQPLSASTTNKYTKSMVATEKRKCFWLVSGQRWQTIHYCTMYTTLGTRCVERGHSIPQRRSSRMSKQQLPQQPELAPDHLNHTQQQNAYRSLTHSFTMFSETCSSPASRRQAALPRWEVFLASPVVWPWFVCVFVPRKPESR